MPAKAIASIEPKHEGIGVWGLMHGQRASSTRMELAGLVNAMARNVAIHIGIDNASTVMEATMLQEEAVRRCTSSMENDG